MELIKKNRILILSCILFSIYLGISYWVINSTETSFMSIVISLPFTLASIAGYENMYLGYAFLAFELLFIWIVMYFIIRGFFAAPLRKP